MLKLLILIPTMHIWENWKIVDQDHRLEKKDSDRSKIDWELDTVTIDYRLKIEIATIEFSSSQSIFVWWLQVRGDAEKDYQTTFL